MENGNVVDIKKKGSDSKKVEYTIVFHQSGAGLSFRIYGVRNTYKDRLAVADALRAAADNLDSA